MALGKLQSDVGLNDIIKVLAENNNQDPILRHAGIMGLVGVQDSAKLQSLKTNSSEAVRLAAVVALRKQANPIISDFLGDASTSVIKEAVRAIHDVPKLHVQLASVADLPLASNAEDAVVHRVLNAGFRLGRKQDAIKLANFASSSNGSEAMRLEALEMLASWSKPGLRDRVMNRHLPLADRNGDVATQAIRDRIELLSAAPAKIRDKFLEIGASMGITEISQLLQTTAKDSKAPGARRSAAIRALAGLEPKAIPELIAMAILDSDADVRIAGLGLQVAASPEKAISNLAKSIESTTPSERQFAWDQLGTLELLEAKRLLSQGALAYLDGTLPSDCRLNVAESVAGKLQGDVLKRWEEYAAKKQAAREQAPQDYYVDCTDGGDVNRGRNLFFTRSNLSCVRCHKVGQIGGEVGPALGALGSQKSRAYLLEAIVAPNTTIAQGFETAVILDTEGNTVSGIIKSEDDEQIVLMDAQGAVVTIEKESIEARRKGSSSMPADLMKYLNQRELRDLVAYLASLDGSPEATVGLDSAQSGHQVE
jgi:quinoprotein glucose dehydrogenase